jgi:hypothetical protein
MFRISSQDNGLYFFRDREDVARCTVCGELLKKWEEDLASVSISKAPKYDLSYSYDGVLVATRRVKELIEHEGLTGMSFRPLQRDLFAARPNDVVAFDAKRRGTRFEEKCEACGSYESVIGATPVLLRAGAVIAPNAFARTDLEFGSNDEKTPLVLCGDDAARALTKGKLRGVDLMPVDGMD